MMCRVSQLFESIFGSKYWSSTTIYRNDLLLTHLYLQTYLRFHFVPEPAVDKDLRQHATRVHDQSDIIRAYCRLAQLKQIGAYYQGTHDKLESDDLRELRVYRTRESVKQFLLL